MAATKWIKNKWCRGQTTKNKEKLFRFLRERWEEVGGLQEVAADLFAAAAAVVAAVVVVAADVAAEVVVAAVVAYAAPAVDIISVSVYLVDASVAVVVGKVRLGWVWLG